MVEYSLVFCKRKTITIIVRPDLSVEVRAPNRVSKREVESFVHQKQAWVVAKQNEFSQRPTPHQPVFSEGADHYFLGESHRLVDIAPAAAKTTKTTLTTQLPIPLGLELDMAQATIALKGIQQAAPEKVERKLEQWYRHEALALFTERHAYWREQMQAYHLPDSHVVIRKMKRRWGSCSSRGKITFSTTLAKYPLPCVDAVVVHELCHLLEFSHNKRFYRFMDQVYPNWKQYDKQLQQLSWQY